MIKPVLLGVAFFMLLGCTYRSDGAYIRGHGSSEFFAPIHSGAVGALSPSLEEQYCYGMGHGAQDKKYEKQRRVVVENSELKEDNIKYNYDFKNKCK